MCMYIYGSKWTSGYCILLNMLSQFLSFGTIYLLWVCCFQYVHVCLWDSSCISGYAVTKHNCSQYIYSCHFQVTDSAVVLYQLCPLYWLCLPKQRPNCKNFSRDAYSPAALDKYSFIFWRRRMMTLTINIILPNLRNADSVRIFL